MSDNWNPPPGHDPADREPAEGDQPTGPPRRPAGDGRPGQWWTEEDIEAKREFQDPSSGERPRNNWFGEGWANRRPVDPDQPSTWETAPEQSRPGQQRPPQSGPRQPGPAQSGPAQGGPAQGGPAQSGPTQGGPRQSAPGQPGPARPGPGQAGPTPTGPRQSGPAQYGPTQGGPAQGGPAQSGPAQGGPSQGGPAQYRPTSGPTPGDPTQSRPTSGPAQSRPAQSGPTQSGSAPADPGRGGPSQPGPAQSRPAQSWPGQSRPAQSGPSGPGQGQPPRQEGPSSQGSYLWGPPELGKPQQEGSSAWSATPSSAQQGTRSSGARHAAAPGGQTGPMGQPVQQEPTWQYPPVPIPQPPGSGRGHRGRRNSRTLLIGLVVLAVLVVGSGITLLVRNAGADSPQATNTPSTAPSESPSESPSPTPSPSPSPSPSPPVPSRDDQLVTANKLYKIGPIATASCAEPPFVPANFAAARNYYNRLLPCLNRTWSLAMKKAGIRFVPPKAVVYVGQIASPCGVQRSARAAYCATNLTIYVPYGVDNRNFKSNAVYSRALRLNTFAHEYGHHVQYLTGILVASMARSQKMSPAQKLLESRRRELQATCLGGAYLGANAAVIPMNGPLLVNFRFLIAHTGDDYSRPRVHTHGNRVSNYQWLIAGYNRKSPNYCNTFTAAPARVA